MQLEQNAAANDVYRLAAAGGDGTLYEAVRGLGETSAPGKVTIGVIPTGMETFVATNIGVANIGGESADHIDSVSTASTSR